MSETVLERIQSDTKAAMKAGQRQRVGALRMLANALQQNAKEGDAEEVEVLQRERKKRLEAAEAYEQGGSSERAADERAEAELIDAYLPEQLSDDELERIVVEAVEATGASEPGEIGKVMGAVMPKVKGRADGKRVSAAVREKLGS